MPLLFPCFHHDWVELGVQADFEVQRVHQVSVAENVTFVELSRTRRISSPFSVNVARPDSMMKGRMRLS